MSTRLEAELSGRDSGFRSTGSGFWVRQRSDDGQAVINAKSSRQQGVQLGGVSVFRFDPAGQFRDRIEAKSATLEPGYWRLEEAAVLRQRRGAARSATRFRLTTNLTPAQVGESFATPGDRAVLAAAVVYRYCRKRRPGRRRLSTAVLPAVGAAVSISWPWCFWPPRSACGSSASAACRRSCLGGIGAGFLLYVMAKVTGDLSKAGLMASDDRGGVAAGLRRRDRFDRAAVPGGWVMARAGHPSVDGRAAAPGAARWSFLRPPCAGSRAPAGVVAGARRSMLTFPPRPKPAASSPTAAQEQMLVRAEEINYDYTNERVSAVGNVQLYYGGSTLEADRVIYDQKTKRLHAEGNVTLTAGRRHGHPRRDHGSERRLSATASSIRCGSTRPSRPASPPRARSGRAAITRSSITASTPPASRARTIRRSRRNGR